MKPLGDFRSFVWYRCAQCNYACVGIPGYPMLPCPQCRASHLRQTRQSVTAPPTLEQLSLPATGPLGCAYFISDEHTVHMPGYPPRHCERFYRGVEVVQQFASDPIKARIYCLDMFQGELVPKPVILDATQMRILSRDTKLLLLGSEDSPNEGLTIALHLTDDTIVGAEYTIAAEEKRLCYSKST